MTESTVEVKVDSRCQTSQDGWMLPQQPSDTPKKEDSTLKRVQRPPAANNCFLGSPHRHTWPSLPAAAPGTLSKPPPCHSVCFLLEGVCHSSRREGMHAIKLKPQTDVQRELHGAMSTNQQDSGFASAGMKGVGAVKTDIYQKFCLPAWGMWSPFHARVSLLGVYGQAQQDEINGLRRFIWQPNAVDFNLLQMNNFETSEDYKLRSYVLEKTRSHQQ